MVEFLAEWGNIITFLIGLAALGGFIWRAIGWMNQQQNLKEDRRIKLEEAKAAQIKKELEVRGEQIRTDAIRTAADVKREVEVTANVIKSELEMTARNLRDHNLQTNEILRNAIKEVDEKVMKMLQDLSERASLTNGNVELIRNEVQDVKEDVQDLWDRFDDTDHALGTNEKVQNQKLRKKRAQEFDRRRKRKEIKDDSEEQEVINRGYSIRR